MTTPDQTPETAPAAELEATPGAPTDTGQYLDPKRTETAQAVASARQRLNQQLDQLNAAERSQLDAERRGAVAALVGLAERSRNEARALPCWDSWERGDVHGAVDACVRAGSRSTCRNWSGQDPNCPRRREAALVAQVVGRLVDAWVPGARDATGADRLTQLVQDRAPIGQRYTDALAEVLLATVGGWRVAGGELVHPRPLLATSALRVVQAFVQGGSQSVDLGGGRQLALAGGEWLLILGGAMATGKTVAAAWACLDRPALFVAAPELVQHDAPISLRAAAETPLLVLDDLGSERNASSNYAVDTLSDLLVLRHRHRRRTIVTTNLKRQRPSLDLPPGPSNPAGLLERYGERLFDPGRGRVLEGVVLVAFTGDSQRGAR